MVAETSPTVRQRELGKRLRELRGQHGLTVEEVADKLLCSATKIRRLETGARGRVFVTFAICARYTVLAKLRPLIS